MHARGNRAGDAVLVKVAYHPFWQIRGSDGAVIEMDDDGMMNVNGLARAEQVIDIVYKPPAWPMWVSIAGWLGVALLGLPRRQRANNSAAA
jgi:hypothetical protein